MRYLLGDSTDSGLEHNYLAFLREVVDCVVALLASEVALAQNVERRDARANESAGLVRATEELGKEVAALVEPIVKEQPSAPAGRCASAIARAAAEAVTREAEQAKAALAALDAELAAEDTQIKERARAALDKLLLSSDLP